MQKLILLLNFLLCHLISKSEIYSDSSIIKKVIGIDNFYIGKKIDSLNYEKIQSSVISYKIKKLLPIYAKYFLKESNLNEDVFLAIIFISTLTPLKKFLQ